MKTHQSISILLMRRKEQLIRVIESARHHTHQFYWQWVLCLILFRIVLTADFVPGAWFAPHDASLYVERAAHLVAGNELGPYNSRVLVKIPGFSFLLAAFSRWGIPYDVWILLLQIAAGLAVARGSLKFTGQPLISVVCISLSLLHPAVWVHAFETIRETAQVGLYLALFGVTLSLSLTRSVITQFAHNLAAAFLLVIVGNIREDDFTLAPMLGMIVGVANILSLRSRQSSWSSSIAGGILSLLLSVGALIGTQYHLTQWVGERYTYARAHDLSYGAYPKLIASLRAIDSDEQSRYVMIPHSTLLRVSEHVPDFKLVTQRINRPKPLDPPCWRFDECENWTNGYLVFWIRDAADESGLLTDPIDSRSSVRAESKFGQWAEQISRLCGTAWTCSERGHGIFWPLTSLSPTSFAYESALGFISWIHPVRGLKKMPLDLLTDIEHVRNYYRVLGFEHKSLLSRVGGQVKQNFALQMFREVLNYTVTFATSLLLLYFPFKFRSRRYLKDDAHMSGKKILLFSWIAFFGVKWLALSYSAYTMGPVDDRLYFAAHIVCVLAVILIFELERRSKPELTKE
ncbi:MAG TPA: hypothetical protein PLZ57_16370 [Pseudobdellovibrionaceae bacterium]|nr:hypothetical protein [Pseudobdellovibrionaceae bacterium]